MAGVDDDVVRQRTQAVDDRVVELLGEPLGLLRSEQIRPPDLAGEEDVAGEERDGIRTRVRVDQQVAEVLGSVARRPERPQSQAADGDLIAVVERMVGELLLSEATGVDRWRRWPPPARARR